MNYLHFLTFILFMFSAMIAGVGIYEFLNNDKESYLNHGVYLGEILLLGSILLVGELLSLSIIGLYKGPYLWCMVGLNYLFLLKGNIRKQFYMTVCKKITWDIPQILFMAVVAIFIFRNCYYMVDHDDHMAYLYTQKVWLSSGTSLINDVGIFQAIYFPQFDSIPYALGIALFGQETLFPQLINLYWRLLVVILAFGYTSYRFTQFMFWEYADKVRGSSMSAVRERARMESRGRLYGVAAALLIVLNDHIFYSGANQAVIINAALIALLFAAAYNIWESKAAKSSFRFLLAIIFATQVMANKYQMVYSLFFLFGMGIYVQSDFLAKTKNIVRNKRWLFAVLAAIFLMLLWPLKTFLAVGDPVFPAFAGKFHALGWTPEREAVFLKFFGGLAPQKFLKYMNYLFIWPGIVAAKYVITTISFLPLIFLVAYRNKDKTREDLTPEFVFWLALSVFMVMGTCLGSHWDPRYYRYSIGILSFTAVLSIYYVLRYCLRFKNQLLTGIIVILLSLPGYRIVTSHGGGMKRPTFRENIGVLTNKIHMDYIVRKHYPEAITMSEGLRRNSDKARRSAWLMGEKQFHIPLFLVPIKPVLSLWHSAVIKWESYAAEDSIIKDLREYGVEWVMTVRDNKLIFIPIRDYARKAVQYNRYPTRIVYDYGFPDELAEIRTGPQK